MFDQENSSIAEFDKELWHAIQAENRRQEQHIELIASENYVSRRVLAAQGSVLTNKYAKPPASTLKIQDLRHYLLVKPRPFE